MSYSKSSMPHPERTTKAEHFCCGHTVSLLTKLLKTIIQILSWFICKWGPYVRGMTNLKSGRGLELFEWPFLYIYIYTHTQTHTFS